jgi:dTDP-glucose 4,6-dehydratase
VIPTIVAQALSGSEIRLGDLSPTRDFNYVADTVEGFICAATEERAIGRTINLGSGVEISIGDVANMIGHLIGKDLKLVPDEQRVRPQNSEVARLCADATLARDLIGWRTHVALEDGLRRTITWMQENLENYRAKEYAV